MTAPLPDRLAQAIDDVIVRDPLWTDANGDMRTDFAARFGFEDRLATALLPLIEAEKAEVWDEGYSTCLGDFDIAARAESRSSNPYQPESEDK